MGLSEGDAKVEARASGNSPSIWKVWNLYNNSDPADVIPEWATQNNSELAVPAVLLGGWSENTEGDIEVIEEFTGKEYQDYRDQLSMLVNMDNPLLVRIDDTWVISAPTTAFALVTPYITQGHLEKLSAIAQKVFEEIDPSINLPPDERPYVELNGQKIRHSSWMRDGLASSLLHVAVIGERLEKMGVIPNNVTSQSYANSIINQLEGLRTDWRLIASLSEQIPVLAEAAPVPFLEALENLLQGDPNKIQPIFNDGDNFFSHSFHTGLLWGLETLAWSPKYLGRVGIILAQLAEIDPGGNVSNRPINSLREIFLAWHSGTNASLDQRLQVLELILERKNEIGWNLLVSLMPRLNQISTPTSKPLWRDFESSSKEGITNQLVWNTYRSYVDLAIRYAGRLSDRWIVLIDSYPDVSERHQEAILDGLRMLSESKISQEESITIWESLRNFINKHKQFPDAAWALSEESLENLETVKNIFTPTELIEKIAWLFNDYTPDIPFPRTNHDSTINEVNRLRHNSVKELWEQGNFERIKQLINTVSYPELIAKHLIEIINDKDILIKLMEQTNQGTDREKTFARRLSGNAYHQFEDNWTHLLLSQANKLNWTPNEYVNALWEYPDSKKTYELVENLDGEIGKEYWTSRPKWIHSNDRETLLYTINKLREYGRALDAIVVAERKWGSKDVSLIFELLDEALQELNQGNSSQGLMDAGYYIEELFDWLRKQNEIDKLALARREYAYLPLLTRGMKKQGLAIHEILATDPTFFIQILCDLYGSTSESSETSEYFEPTEDMKRRAEIAFGILNSWKSPPGVGNNGEVDGEALKNWIKIARQLAIENDRLDIADQEIGKILFHFPEDPDDSIWPHVELRKLLEDLQSQNLETGIELEQFNSRGVTTKEMFEGGDQERAIVRKWKAMSKKIGLRWPRTKTMFEKIVASWEHEAKREDERAEKDRLRFR